MAVIGVVCEYNPFHNGHARHLDLSRLAVEPEAPVICVMSGDFVQRGEAAIYSKYARAEAACRCGANLVIELPLPWALSSAEGFARGAVGLLSMLGATELAFGSETGELEDLEHLAQTILDPELQQEVKQLMAEDGTLSYATARQWAAAERLGATADLLSMPNNILAVEYLKAIYSMNLPLNPLAVRRVGSGHDQTGDGSSYYSASEVRQIIASERSISHAVPAEAAEVYARERKAGREIREKGFLEMAILSRLRMLTESDYLALPDAADGMGRRLFRAVRTETSYDAVLAAAKTKRYALSRIRRMCMCACLGIREGMAKNPVPYARVLAADWKGRDLLREISDAGKIPLVTKPASVRRYSKSCQGLFALDSYAHDFYVLGYPAERERRPGEDWRTGPKILDL